MSLRNKTKNKRKVKKIIYKYGYKMYPVQEQLQVLLHHNPRVKHEDFSWMYSYIGSNAFKMTTLGSGGYHGITQ